MIARAALVAFAACFGAIVIVTVVYALTGN